LLIESQDNNIHLNDIIIIKEMYNLSNNSKKSLENNKELKTYPYKKILIVLGYVYVLLLYLSLPIIHNVALVLGLFGFIIYMWYMNKKKDPKIKFHLQIMIVLIAIWVFVYPAILVYLPWK